MPEYNQVMNDPNMMATLNSHAVPSITLASLATLKTAKTFMDFNLNCLKNQGKNLYNLEGFEQWQSTGACNGTISLFENTNQELNKNWFDFMNQAQNVQFNPEDKHHVVDKINGDMDIKILRNVMKMKIKEMSYLLDFQGFNEDMKCKVAQCVIYSHMATRITEIFDYSDNFNAQLILEKFETMNLDELRKVVNSYNV